MNSMEWVKRRRGQDLRGGTTPRVPSACASRIEVEKSSTDLRPPIRTDLDRLVRSSIMRVIGLQMNFVH
jgi:hypothetical protein